MSILNAESFDRIHTLFGNPECTVYHIEHDTTMTQAEMLGLVTDTASTFTAKCVYSPITYRIASTDDAGRILSVQGLEILIKLSTGQTVFSKDLILLPSDEKRYAISNLTVDGIWVHAYLK
jgi:hypothetical protein